MITLPSPRVLVRYAALALIALALAFAPLEAVSQTHALDLNGSSTYVTFDEDWTVEETYTVEGWFRTTDGSSHQTIFAASEGSEVLFVSVTGGRVRFFSRTYDDATGSTLDSYNLYSPSGTDVADGTWHHVAAVRDEEDVLLYLDGELVDSEEYCGPLACSQPEKDGVMVVGRRRHDNASRYFDGQIDELVVWEKALSASQVWRRQYEELNASDSDIIAAWAFDEGSGSSVDDQAGSVDGTVQAGADWADVPRVWADVIGSSSLSNGTRSLGSTDLSISVTDHDGGTFWAARFDAQPDDLPMLSTGAADDRLLDDRYWLTDVTGGDAPTASLIFEVTGAFTLVDGLTPSHVRLYHRASEDDAWEEVATASEVDESASTATFEGVETVGLFMIGLGPVQDYDEIGTVTLSNGTHTLGNTDLSITVTAHDGGTFWAARYDTQPDVLPTLGTGAADDRLLDDRYWFADVAGGDAPTASLIFEVTGAFTLVDDLTPSAVRLYHRASEDDAWEEVTTASEVDHAASTATFEGMDPTGFFMIGLGPIPSDDLAIALDGVDGYLAADGVMEHLTNGFTVETWVRPDESASSGSNTVLSMHSSTGDNRFMVYYSGGSVNSFRLYSEGTTLSGTATFEPGRWYHVAVTGDTDGLSLYIDGVLHIEDTTWNDYAQSDGRFSLGQEWDSDNTSQHLHATFDEVRAWDEVRSLSDIRAMRHTALAGDEAGLVGYWPLTLEYGAADRAGTADMTLHGGAAWVDSAVPVGDATTTLAYETPGAVGFAGTGVEARYLSQNGALVGVTRLSEAPSAPPSGLDVTAVLDAQSWLFERYARGLFNATLTFEAAEGFTASDEALPAQIHLYSRPGGSDSADDWERVASASEVDAGSGTATFRGIRSFSQFVLVRGPILPDAVLSATDDSHEDRVALYWEDMPPGAAELRVTRLADTTDATAVTLSVLASDADEYDDYSGEPSLGYTYCLVVQDAFGNASDEFCDAGSRRLSAPENLSASDGHYDTEVALSWTDRSSHESGYVVFRDGDVIADLGTNQTSYSDESAVALTPYTYCVGIYEDADGDDAYTDGVDFLSETSCDDGERGAILPPAAVTASDGEYPSHVEVAWTEQAEDADGYRVTRSAEAIPGEPALYFDGSDGYVDIGNFDELFSRGSSFTVEMWIKPESSSNRYIMYQPHDNGSVNLSLLYQSNKIYFAFNGGPSSTVSVPVGNLAHVAVSFDGSIATLYIDGVFQASDDLFTNSREGNNATYLGARVTSDGAISSHFDGVIDDVRIWDDVRTQEEIEAHLYEKLDGDEANLVAYFPFDEGEGATSTDLVGDVAVDLGAGGVDWVTPLDVTLDPGVGRYDDDTAVPGFVYTYCVRTVSGDTESVAICDDGGIDVLAAPENVTATDEAYDDRVLVTWDDVAGTEDAFRVYRTHPDTDEVVLLATTNANEQAFIDADAEAGVAYAYCVEAVAITQDADGEDQEALSAQDCDEGVRSHVLPVSGVEATEGDHEDRIGLTWTNEATTAALLRIYRDGVLIKTTAAGNTLYDDFAIASGDTLTYCIEAVTPESVASAQVCADGFRTLAAPTDVAATDDAEEDEVVVTWADNSAVEAGYEVYRQASAPSSVLLTGDGDHALIPSKEVIDAEEGTIELWARPELIEQSMLVHAGETNGQGGGTQDEMWVMMSSDGTVTFSEYATDGIPFSVRSTTALEVGEYTHLAVTWSASESSAALYVNGVLEDEAEFSGLTPALWNDEVKLGSHQDQDYGSRYFGGDLDEVRFWSVARSVEEIQAGMTAAPAAGTDGLVASYAFDEGVGTFTADASGNGYHATLDERAGWGEQVVGYDGTLVGTKASSRLSLTDFAGAPGLVYTYRVRAFDAYGVSETDEDTGRRTLAAPNSFTASDSTSETVVELSWSDESRVEAGYLIYRKEVGADVSALVATTEQRATSYTDTLSADLIGTRFAYSVVAFDSYGTSTSVTEEGATGLLPPSSVNASSSYEDEVVLTWIDESGLENGYYVLRGLAASAIESQALDSLGAVGAGVTTFTDATAESGTSYVYCVVTYSGDAHTGCTSAYDTGERYVPFVESDGEIVPLYASDASEEDRFGTASRILGDRAVVAAVNADDRRGAAYVFEKVDDVWAQTVRLGGEAGSACELENGDQLGEGNALALSETHIALGAISADGDDGFALVYAYDEVGETWECAYRLDSPVAGRAGQFGNAFALTDTYIYVGEPNVVPTAKVQIYELATGDYVGTFNHPLGVRNGFGADLATDGDYLLIAARSFDVDLSNAGSVYVYELDASGTGEPVARLISSDLAASDNFGSAVALAGDYAIVSANLADVGSLTDAGKAYLFEVAEWEDAGGDLGKNGDDVLTEVAKLTASDARTGDEFGFSVSLSATSILVGAPRADGVSSSTGAAYYYQLDEDDLVVDVGTILSDDPAKEDHFGWSVAVADDGTTLVGARNEDEKGNSAGAAYITASGLEPIFAPDAVTATDGVFDNRIQLAWGDRTGSETGYRIYRDGEALTETSPNVVSYSDFDAAPGVLYTYCVETLSDLLSSSDQVCDAGWRPPNGSISGRVNSEAGAGIDSVQICIAPPANLAMLFDGVGGHLEISDDQSLDIGNTFTLETWVRYTETAGSGSADASIFDKTDSTSTPLALRVARSTATAGQVLCERVSENGAVATVTSDAAIALNDDAWHHVACVGSVDDAGSATLSVYLDGALSNSVAVVDTLASTSNDSPLYIGRQNGSDDHHFAGRVDEVRLWQVARTAEQILADYTDALYGDEDELAAYWPLDQETDALPTITGRPNHAVRHGGAYPTESAAPLDVCALTDADGAYTLPGINYGEATTFSVVASRESRSFEPPTASITLSNESPVQNELIFIDVSSFSIAGVVSYPSPFDGTTCPAEDIEIHLGLPGGDLAQEQLTEKDGAYLVAADLGDYEIAPYRIDEASTDGDGLVHTFDPTSRFVTVGGDVTGVHFDDVTTRQLTGFVGGACGIGIGTIALRLYTENGCFTHEIEAEGAFTLDLPPQRYLAEVIDVELTADVSKADVLEYFDALGPIEIDLTTQSDTLEVIYEAPLTVAISGFPGEDEQMCAAEDALGAPVLYADDSGFVQPVEVTITVQQDYGDGQVCLVEDGTLTIVDEIATPAVSAELTLEDGQAIYEVRPGAPNILEGFVVEGVDRSYQKPLTVIAEVEGRDPLTEIEWVIVEGVRARTAEFLTMTTDPVPLLVLRDPPGDASFSSIVGSDTDCSSFDYVVVETLAGKYRFETGIKREHIALAGGGYGVIFLNSVTDNDVQYTVQAIADTGLEGSQGEGETICTVVQDGLSTSASETYVGADADLIVGAGLNLIFGLADELSVDGATCDVDLTETIRSGTDAEPFSTVYAYTQGHIRDHIIPTIENLMALDSTFTQITGEADSTYALPEFFEGSRYRFTGDPLYLSDARDNWVRQLQANDAARVAALESATENRSFDAGTAISHSTTTDTTSTDTYKLNAYVTAGGKSEWSSKLFGFTGKSSVEVTLKLSTNNTWKETDKTSRTSSYKLADNDMGDHFSVDVAWDDRFNTYAFGLRSGVTSNPWEAGPQFDDPFQDCFYLDAEPCELDEADGWPFSQPRDKPTLAVTPPSLSGVDPNGAALFSLALGNESESQERRTYVLKALSTENPHGARFRANGAGITGGLALEVEPGTVQNVTLEVLRGPSKYIYDSLAIVTYPPGEYAIYQKGGPLQLADTVYISVAYDAACSDISILRPRDPWSRNALDFTQTSGGETENPLELILNGFTLSSEDLTVDKLGIAYRRAGTPTWTDVFDALLTYEAPSDDWTTEELNTYPDGRYTNSDGSIVLDPSATSYELDWTGLTDDLSDGDYELRAYTDCGGDRVYSEVVNGTRDTAPPVALGTPQPADQVLNLGDDIAVEFAEAVACPLFDADGAGDNDNVLLQSIASDGTLGDPLAITLACDGTNLVIAPDTDIVDLEDLEHETLRVTLVHDAPVAPADLLGNPLEADLTWDFVVRRSSVAFSPVSVAPAVTRGTEYVVETSLVNGRGQPVAFTLVDSLRLYLDVEDDALADSLVLAPSAWTGDVVSGGSQPLSYVLPDTLALGTWSGSVMASLSENAPGGTVDLGTAPFYVSAEVACGAPSDWAVRAADFQHSMSVIAQLQINGTPSEDEGDVIAAYVDGEVRGVAALAPVTVDGVPFYQANLVIYANVEAGELITLQVWDDDDGDGTSCTLYTDASPALVFDADAVQGTVTQPITVSAPADDDPNALDLEAGWSWISINTDEDDSSVAAIFEDVAAGSSDLIKSQTDFSQYDTEFGWVGSLASLVPGEAYLVYLQQSSALLLEGSATDATTPLDLNAGWNWLGYLPQDALSISDAFGDLEATDGDLIKSQTAFAQYSDAADGWVGSLATLSPGVGYRIYLAEGATLVYPEVTPTAAPRYDEYSLADHADASASDSAARLVESRAAPKRTAPMSKREARDEEGEVVDHDANRPAWSAPSRSHPFSMTVVAELDEVLAAQPGAIVGAFVGDELRGVAQPQYIEGIDAYRVFLIVHGDPGDDMPVTLRAYVPEQPDLIDLVHEADNLHVQIGETLHFEPGLSLGTVSAPVHIAPPADVTQDAEMPTVFALDANHPNPFVHSTTLRYALPETSDVRLVIYDALGRRVARIVDTKQEAGRYAVSFDASGLAAGVYLVRMEAGAFVQVRRIVRLR